jgi:hypothetical protein
VSPRPGSPLVKSRSPSESWRRDRYCLIGSTLPPRPSADEAVAPPQRTSRSSRLRHFAQGFNPGLCPLVELRLLQSMTRPCHRPSSRGLRPRFGRFLSWGSTPLRRLSHGGSTVPELASLRSLRSQDFSSSQRVAPRHTFRPCFMPVASLGFHPSELSPLKEPCHLSAACALLAFTASRSRRQTRTVRAKRA